MRGQKYRRVDDTVFQEVDGDIVALNIRQGNCYGMENVTAAVWNMLAEPISEAEICERLNEIYDVDRNECQADVSQLLDAMLREGLVEQAGSAAPQPGK